MFFDNLAIPRDAKNVDEAYELINYLYRPDVAAKNSEFPRLCQRQSRQPEADRSERSSTTRRSIRMRRC